MSSAATEKPIESCLAQNAFSGGRRGQWRPARGSSSLRTARCRHWSLPALSSPKACIVRHQGVSRQRKTLPGAGSNRQAARPCHQWRARRKRPKLRCLRSPCTDPRHRGLAYDNLLGACGAATRLGPSERLKHARGLAKNVQPGSEPEPGSQRWDSDEHRDMVACRRVHEGPTERIQSTAGSPSARREHRRRHGRRFRRGVHGRSTAWATKTNHAQSASGFPLLSVLLSLRPESASRGNKRTCPPPRAACAFIPIWGRSSSSDRNTCKATAILPCTLYVCVRAPRRLGVFCSSLRFLDRRPGETPQRVESPRGPQLRATPGGFTPQSGQLGPPSHANFHRWWSGMAENPGPTFDRVGPKPRKSCGVPEPMAHLTYVSQEDVT